MIQFNFPPELYRWLLFAGLAAHKIVWEVLKVKQPLTPEAALPKLSLIKRMLKLGKTLFLIFLVIQTLFLNVLPISRDPVMLRIIGFGIFFIGLAVALTGRFQLGRNWANLEDYQVLPDQALVQTGIYHYIRHPIYSGDLLLILGLELALNSWLVLLIIPLTFVVFRQTLREEKILAQSFEGYSEYRRRSKMFIPFVI